VSSGGPASGVAVILPAYRAEEHLAACVESILSQHLAEPFEVLVIVSGEEDDDIGYADELFVDPRLVVVRHKPRLSAAQARSMGVVMTDAPLVVFTDADVVAEEGWLGALVESATRENCVAGAVVNGTPRSWAGTTEYLVEFLDLHPRRPAGSLWHGATCSLALTREAWERWGPLVDVRPLSSERGAPGSADTVLTMKAASEGQLAFCSRSKVRHMNRTRMADVLSHQFALGRNAARLANVCEGYPLRRLMGCPAAAPLVVAARWVSLWKRLLLWRTGARARAVLLSGHVLAALSAWGAGLFTESRRMRNAGS
jgi:glycosyltransferase involved in cell wall biosynthesis